MREYKPSSIFHHSRYILHPVLMVWCSSFLIASGTYQVVVFRHSSDNLHPISQSPSAGCLRPTNTSSRPQSPSDQESGWQKAQELCSAPSEALSHWASVKDQNYSNIGTFTLSQDFYIFIYFDQDLFRELYTSPTWESFKRHPDVI